MGNPINAGIGDKVEVETDYTGTGPFPLIFRRTYHSIYGPYVTSLGGYWTTNFDKKVLPTSSASQFRVTRGDGRVYLFALSGNVGVPDADVADQLVRLVDTGGNVTGWQYTTSDDDVERYDASGTLQSITNRAGFTQTLAYSAPSPSDFIAGGLLLSVTDPTGRQLQFTYDSVNRIATMTDPNGGVTTYGYTYGTGGTLISRTDPNQTTRTYLYNEQKYTQYTTQSFALTGIQDENNARYATFGYNSAGQAVSTQHAGGADAVTLSYSGPTTTAIDALGATRTYVSTNQFGVFKPGTLTQPCPSCSGGTVQSSHTYDANGYPYLDTDFNGVVTAHTYGALDASGHARGLETQRIEASTDTTGAKRTLQTDWHASFRVPVERRTYNAAGVPSGLESRTQWAYNSRGQATARCEIDPSDSVAMAYACSATTAPPAGAKVRRTVTTYCEASDVTAGTCPLVGLVTSVNGPRPAGDVGMTSGQDDVTTYTYYPSDDPTCATNGACPHRHGDLWKVTNALGQVTTTVSYDKNGRVTRTQDANGTFTDFTYHPRGWLLTRTVRANPDGSVNATQDATTTIAYDAVGNVTQVTQPDGTYLHYGYDAAHRLIKITDALGDVIDYCPGGVGSAQCLDAAGNRLVEQVKDPSGTLKRSLSRTIDSLNHLTAVLNAASTAVQTWQNPAEAPPSGIAYTNGYDGNGNAVYAVDGNGVGTEQQYDPLNRLVKTLQDHTGKSTATQDTTTQYAYDTRDNLRSVTDPDHLTTSYTYDGLNNLTQVQSPDTGTTQYGTATQPGYDAAGNRLRQTDNRGTTSTYTYDALNRLIAISYPTTTLNVTYAYDQPNSTTGCTTSFPIGRLTTMADSTGTTTYCYDRRGNVLSKTFAPPPVYNGCTPSPGHQCTTGGGVTLVYAPTFQTTYGYSTADRLMTLTYPSGATVTYGRDTVGRITSVKYQPLGGAQVTVVSTVSYAPFGPLTQLAFGNGRSLTKTYDQNYAIQSIASSSPSGLTLGYGVDVLGNVMSASTSLNPVTPDRQYGYDPLYRLTTVQTGATPSSPLEAYTYGPTGDRTSASLNGAAAQPYTYTAGTHHLTSVNGTARTYDPNGNTTGIGSTALTYDDRNRLTNAGADYNGRGERMVKATGTVPGLYVYLENGSLASEYVGSWQCGGGGGGSTSSAIHALNTSVSAPVTCPSGTVPYVLWGASTDYLYLDGVPVALASNGSVDYIETDHLGTPRKVIQPGSTTSTDTVVWSWDNLGSAFGTNAPTGSLTMNLRFPGQYYDQETGLNYNYKRDYESGTGRYTQSDPIGLGGGLTTYAYVSDSPLQLSDSSGLVQHKSGEWIDCGAGCWIRIDFTIDPRTNEKIRHLHWYCNGEEGECGEHGLPSHGGGTWNDAPRRIKECAEKNGFQGAPRPYAPPQPNQNFQPPTDPPWWILLIILLGLSNPVTA